MYAPITYGQAAAGELDNNDLTSYVFFSGRRENPGSYDRLPQIVDLIVDKNVPPSLFSNMTLMLHCNCGFTLLYILGCYVLQGLATPSAIPNTDHLL